MNVGDLVRMNPDTIWNADWGPAMILAINVNGSDDLVTVMYIANSYSILANRSSDIIEIISKSKEMLSDESW